MLRMTSARADDTVGLDYGHGISKASIPPKLRLCPVSVRADVEPGRKPTLLGGLPRLAAGPCRTCRRGDDLISTSA